MTYLEDQSANGTFVNDRVVGKGRKIPLAHVAKIALSLPHNKGRQSLLGMPKRKTYFGDSHTHPPFSICSSGQQSHSKPRNGLSGTPCWNPAGSVPSPILPSEAIEAGPL